MICIDVVLDAEGILHSAQCEQFVQTHTRKQGLGGLGTGREDQLVVAFLKFLTVFLFFTETVFRCRWMAVTSWRTFMFKQKWEKKLSDVWMVRSYGLVITSLIW